MCVEGGIRGEREGKEWQGRAVGHLRQLGCGLVAPACRQGQCAPWACVRAGAVTHQLDVVDGFLSELLDGPLGLRLQREGEALQGLALAFHADLSLHLVVQGVEGGPHPGGRVSPTRQWRLGGVARDWGGLGLGCPTSSMRICCSSLSAEVSGAGAAQDDRCFWYPARERSS